jgi:hypothetical protein
LEDTDLIEKGDDLVSFGIGFFWRKRISSSLVVQIPEISGLKAL